VSKHVRKINFSELEKMFFLVWGQDAYPGELALEGPIGHGVSGQIFAAAFRGRRVAVKTLLNEVRTARALQSEWTAPLVPVLVDPGPCHSRFQATCLWALADSNLFQSVLNQPPSPDLAAEILSDAAKGVIHYHSLGIAL
jgi:hypothetical protein